MSVTDKNVFTPVVARGDIQRIFNTCIETGKPLLGQSELGARFSFRAKFMTGRQLRGEIKSTQKISAVETVTVLISVFEERYLTRTRFESIDGSEAVLNLESSIFKVQRRDNFRVSIEQLPNARFEVEKINDATTKSSLKMIDLSAGGLGAELALDTKITIQPQDRIVGRLIIPGFFNEVLEGVVRYIKPRGSAGSGIRHLGIHFQNLSASIERELNIRILEIHREFFSKMD